MNVHSEIWVGPKDVDLHVGVMIRQRRKLLRLSQTALGERLGVTFQQMQKYEKGINRVSASRLADMAAALDVPIAFFFPEAGRALAMPDRYDLAAAVARLRTTLKEMDSALADIGRHAS